MSDRWNISDDNGRMRERIAVVERNLQYLQEAINTLKLGQAENRAYSERSFNEVLQAQAELKREVTDLKLALATRPTTTSEQNRVFVVVLAIGFVVSVLVIVMLMLWVRLGTVGVHF